MISQPNPPWYTMLIHATVTHYDWPSGIPSSFPRYFAGIFMIKSCIKSNGSSFRKPTLRDTPCQSRHHTTLWLRLMAPLVIPKTFSSYFLVKNLALKPMVRVFASHPQLDTPRQLTPLCHTMTPPGTLFPSHHS